MPAGGWDRLLHQANSGTDAAAPQTRIINRRWDRRGGYEAGSIFIATCAADSYTRAKAALGGGCELDGRAYEAQA